MKKIMLLSLMLVIVGTVSAELTPGKSYRLISGKSGRTHSMFVNNASLDVNAPVVVWYETNVAAQRWILEEQNGGKFSLRNAYTGYYLAYASKSDGAKITQRAASVARTAGAWVLEPVEGSTDAYRMLDGSNQEYCIGINEKAADGVALQLVDAETPGTADVYWRLIEDSRSTEYDETVRNDIMNRFISRWYRTASTGHVIGNGGWWGDAEMFETILDAFETTGDKRYQTYWDELYTNFNQRNGSNWIGNEYNDDIIWMVLACIRGYKFFGDTKYLNSAKQNFDRMYARAKQQYGTLIWKQSQSNPLATNSCINCPATVAACYLAQLTGDKTYYDKALSIYAAQRKLLFEASTGKVFDSGEWTAGGGTKVNNYWVSTYNQGTMLGAALMLYDYTKDPQYKTDAERIHSWTMKDLCNKYGIVHACQTIAGDLCGFKGIYMRYARRYAEDLGHPEVLEWMAKNAWHGYQNRSSAGIIWSAWLTKTNQNLKRMEGSQENPEEKTCEPFSASTAISVAFNAHINGLFYKNAYGTVGAQYFDEIQWMQIADTPTDDATPETTMSSRAGSFVAFKNVDFGKQKANLLNVRIKGEGNSRLMVYADSIAPSTLIGQTTGALPTTWSNVTIETAKLSGRHHIYLVTAGDGKAAIHSFSFDSTNMLFADLTSGYGKLTINGEKAANLNLIDDDPTTSSLLPTLGEGSGAVTSSLIYTSPVPMSIKAYAIYAAPGEGQPAPSAWTLEGSNDGTNWTKLDTQRGKTFADDGQKHQMTVSTTQTFTTLRLTLSATGTESLSIADWQVYGLAVADNDITDDGGQLEGAEATLTDNDIATECTGAEASVVTYDATMKYKAMAYSVTVNQAAGAPQAWTLEGSADGSKWTELDSRTAQRFALYPSTVCYSIPNGNYSHFRIRFEPLADGSPVRIAELQILGEVAWGNFHNDITADGGKTTASDGSDASAIFDNDPTTIAVVSGTSLWWQHQTAMPTRYRGFSIVAGNNPDRFPTSVTIQGSNDGSAWTDLTTIQPKFSSPYDRYDQTSSISVYNYYRLVVNSVADGGQTAELAEWELHGTAILSEGDLLVPVAESSPQNASMLYDGIPTTTLVTPFTAPFIIDYTLEKPEAVVSYTLTASSNYSDRDPAAWILYGSTDGTSFEEIDRRDGIFFATRYATQFYTCNAEKKAYKHYRLAITETNSVSLQLAEWQLLRLDTSTGIILDGRLRGGERSEGWGLRIKDESNNPSSVYDLQGRRIAHSMKDLQPGVYIVNGKKIIVR